MVVKDIVYFDRPGRENTEETLKAARARAEMNGIRQVVVASTYGETGKKALEFFPPSDFNLVVVTISMGFEEEGWVMPKEMREELAKAGAKVLTATHALGDDLNSAFGFPAPNLVAAETLRRFGQGMKVAVEIALMAADAGLLDMDKEVISIAGTDRGADTAIVLRPAYPRKFNQLRISEIIAKPR